MGGSVAVILRDHQGNVTPMRRWTNVMPFYFKLATLYSNDETLEKEWISSFLQDYLLMKDDYEKNKNNGQFEFEMTSTYFPYDTSAPYSYGLIVVDFLKKRIYSNQSYCSLEYLYFYNLKFDISNNEELNNFELAYNLKIFDTIIIDMEDKHFSYNFDNLSFNEYLEFLFEINDKKPVFSNNKFYELNKLSKYDKENLKYLCKIKINSPWIVSENGTSIKDFLKLKQSLTKDGFIFTNEDNNKWIEYLNLDFDRLNHLNSDDIEIQNLTQIINEQPKLIPLFKEIFDYDLVLLNNKLKSTTQI